MKNGRSQRRDHPRQRRPAGHAADRPLAERSSDERALLETLDATLSSDEARLLLAHALRCLDPPGRERLYGRLGVETGRTVRSVLEGEPKDGKPHAPEPGRRKVLQEWKALWADWEQCIEETGHEGGKYVRQDEHWEPPWLDTSALADDLEKVAAGMRRLLGRVWDEELDPKCSFADSIRDAAESAGEGLPEWTERGEDLQFGPEVTGCLLDWERRAALRDGRGAFDFVGCVRDVERSLRSAALDDDAIGEFIAGLDAEAKREMLDGLTRHRTSERWKEALDAPHTGWFKAWRKLAERADPALFATVCRNNIERDWTLALPLLKKALARKDYAQAESLVRQALPGLLGPERNRPWDPRNVLFLRNPYLRYREEWSADVFRLLEAWRTTVSALGRPDEARALELQILVGRKRDDWDAIATALRDAPASCASLVADWRAEVARASAGVIVSEDGVPELGWQHALVDAVLAEADGGAFREAVRTWLRAAAATRETLDRCRYSLGTLMTDVDGAGELRKTAPRLIRLIGRDRGGSSGTDRVRRRWIERLGGFELFPEVLAFWKRHAAALVPDPGRQTKSNYERCAEWMAAVFEFDRDVHDAIVRRWSVEHERRRNLWQALARRGLPSGPQTSSRP